MKKLIAMIGAVAMSFGLFADATPFFTSFDSGDAGVSGTEYTSSTAGWSGLTDPLTLKAYDTETDPAYAYDGTDRRFTEDNLQYLPLETERTDALNHAIGEGNIFVDQLVRFTGFEDPQTNLVDGVKIAVWMGEFFNDEETAAETNLYVTVGSDNIDGQIAVKLDGTYEINKWYRLTIKSLGNIFTDTSEVDARAGFCIWIDGTKVAIASDDAHYEGLITHSTILTSAAGSAYAQHKLFPAVSFGENEVALNSFGYNGIGAIDDVYVDDVGPDFTAETVDVTFAPITGAVVAKVVDSDGAEFNYPTGVISVKPGDLTVTLAAAENYKMFGKSVYTVNTADAVQGQITIQLDESTKFEEVVAKVVNEDGTDTKFYAESELGALTGLADGDTATILKGCSVKKGDDTLYKFTKDTTIAVSEGGVWTVNVGSEGTTAAKNTLTDNVGAMPGKSIAVSFVNAEKGQLSIQGIVYGNEGTATKIDVNGAVTLVGNLNIGDAYDTVGNNAGALLKAESISFGGMTKYAISLTGAGKVMAKSDEYTDAQIKVPTGETREVVPAADGYFIYQIKAAEPPTEKGFKVIISGVETQVDTLAEAFASADDNTTITFLADVTDATGITVDTKKTLTVDFAGFTYTVNKPGAGSPSTMTQAFQLLKDQTLTFKNGTIKASEDNLVLAEAPAKNIKRFFQSYANFTLEDMTLDGTNLYLNETENAMCEFAHGEVAIKGDTSILAKKDNLDAISVDTWKGKYPDGVKVTIDTTGTISSVKVWTEGTGDYTPGTVALEGGTITELKVDGNDADYAITKSEDVTITTTPAGYFWDNGVLAKCAAEISGTYYNTLAAAFTAAQKGNTITMLKDITLSERIFVKNEEVTLDLAGKKIEWNTAVANKSGVLIVCRDAKLTIDDSSEPSTGVIDAKGKAYAAVALTHGDDPKNSQTDLTAKLIVDGGKLIGNYQGIVGNGTRPNTYIEINGGVITASNEETNQAIFNPQTNSKVVINGGTIEGLDSAIEMRGGSLTVNGGSLTSEATTYSVKPNGSGSSVVGAAVAVSQHTTKGDLAVEIKGGTLTGLNAVAVANPQENKTDNVEVVLGKDATYDGALAFSADGNATVEKDPDAEIAAPQGYRWNDEGVLTKLVTATFISEGQTVDTQVIDAGTEPTNVVVKKEGYTFTGWNPEISAITEDTTYTAQFEEIVYNITIASTEHGKLETSVTNGVAPTTRVTVKVTPDEGYEIAKIMAGKTDITEAKSFLMPYEDVTVTATFKSKDITITVNYDESSILVLDINNQARYIGEKIKLPADTKSVTYGLTKVEEIKIPVFYQTIGTVETRIPRTGSLAVSDGLEVSFSAKDATSDDVSDADARAALKELGYTDSTLNKFPGANVKKFAAWREKYPSTPGDTINKSNYVQASVALDVDLITATTEIKITDLKEVTGGAMTFKVKIATTPMATEAQLGAIKDMVKATKDVTDWTTAEKQLEVTPTADVTTGTVTITPAGSPAAAFMRVVIPTDVPPVDQ